MIWRLCADGNPLVIPGRRLYNQGMSQATHLRKLQAVDSDLAALQARLREVERALADERAVKEAEAAYETARQAHIEAQRAFRNAEAEADAVRDKLVQVERQLYGGAERNPKALQDLQQEAEALRRRLDALETQALQALDTLEAAAARLAQAEEALRAARSRRATERARLQAEREDLQARLERLGALRETLSAQLPAQVRATYERLLAGKGGQAVAVVEDEACGVCGVALSRARLQAVRLGEGLTFCEGCGRILVC